MEITGYPAIVLQSTLTEDCLRRENWIISQGFSLFNHHEHSIIHNENALISDTYTDSDFKLSHTLSRHVPYKHAENSGRGSSLLPLRNWKLTLARICFAFSYFRGLENVQLEQITTTLLQTATTR